MINFIANKANCVSANNKVPMPVGLTCTVRLKKFHPNRELFYYLQGILFYKSRVPIEQKLYTKFITKIHRATFLNHISMNFCRCIVKFLFLRFFSNIHQPTISIAIICCLLVVLYT